MKQFLTAGLLLFALLWDPFPAEAATGTVRPATPTAASASPTVPVAHGRPLWVRVMARCVINHESANWPYDGRPRPYEARRRDGGTASGAYQMVDRTWKHLSRRAGYPGYRRAHHAPPGVQDAVFWWAVTHGQAYHWKGTRCGRGT